MSEQPDERPTVGRIEFGPRTSLSELRRFAVQQPVDAAHRIAKLEAELVEAQDTIEALVAIAEAADPLARLPHPLSADERDDWRVYQERLREALVVWRERKEQR